MARRENEYQSKLIKRIESRFPGCLVLKNDEWYIPGVPDLTVLYGESYAVLEVKRDSDEMRRPGPNQTYYVDLIVSMGGFACFIYPQNEEEVLDALQSAFESRR